MIGLSFVLKRERRRLQDLPEDSPQRKRIEKTIEEAHGMISDLMHDVMQIFKRRP
jgi:hypothetical protein